MAAPLIVGNDIRNMPPHTANVPSQGVAMLRVVGN
jgi:hypothetical protein